jgi:hypothetical protein
MQTFAPNVTFLVKLALPEAPSTVLLAQKAPSWKITNARPNVRVDPMLTQSATLVTSVTPLVRNVADHSRPTAPSVTVFTWKEANVKKNVPKPDITKMTPNGNVPHATKNALLVLVD